jgi:hypothetical protein
MVEAGRRNRNPLTLGLVFGYLSGLWLRITWWCAAPANTTSGDLLPEHLVNQQAPDGEHLMTYRGANGGGA